MNSLLVDERLLQTRASKLVRSPVTFERQSIPDAVRRLLRDRVHSSEALELLLLLRRHSPRVWPLEAVARESALPAAAAAEALEQLAAGGLVEPDAERRFGYRAGTPEVAGAVDELVRIYDSDRTAILRLMSENAIERVRRSMANAFADAFLVDGAGRNGGKRG